MDARQLQERLAGLSADKRAVFEQLLNREKAADGAIRPRDRRLDPPPLSFAQQQLWFLDRLAPSGWFYNESSALHLTHDVDADALERAINDSRATARSAANHFGTAADLSLSRSSHPNCMSRWCASTSRNFRPNSVRASRYRIWLPKDAQMPFDLARPPLMRGHLLRRGDARPLCC